MVWVWLLVPAVILLAAVALWRATGSLAREQRALHADVDELASLGEQARLVRDATRPLRATWREQVDR